MCGPDDRLERQSLEFHRCVRERFPRLSQTDLRIRVIPARDEPDALEVPIPADCARVRATGSGWNCPLPLHCASLS